MLLIYSVVPGRYLWLANGIVANFPTERVGRYFIAAVRNSKTHRGLLFRVQEKLRQELISRNKIKASRGRISSEAKASNIYT